MRKKCGQALPALFCMTLLFGCGGARQKPADQRESAQWTHDAIIDVHGHIGTFKGYDLSTGTLLSNIEKYGVKMVLISNIDGAALPGTTRNLDEVAANRATAEVVRQYPRRLRGLVWTRPNDGSAADVAPFFSQDYALGNARIFVGMKFHPDMNQFPADDARVDAYLEICQSARVPAVFHAGSVGSNSDPKRIYAAGKRFPDVPIVLYHMGFLGPHEPAIAVVRESIEKGDAQLYLETAQAKPQDVVAAVKTLGAARILFGTDATYYGGEHYEHYDALVDALRLALSDDAFSAVVRGNASRLFKLE